MHWRPLAHSAPFRDFAHPVPLRHFWHYVPERRQSSDKCLTCYLGWATPICFGSGGPALGVTRSRHVSFPVWLTLLGFESLVGPRHRSLFACCSTSRSFFGKVPTTNARLPRFPGPSPARRVTLKSSKRIQVRVFWILKFNRIECSSPLQVDRTPHKISRSILQNNEVLCYFSFLGHGNVLYAVRCR